MTAPAEPAIQSLSLDTLAAGTLAQVVEVRGMDDDAVRLKALGICVGRKIQLVKAGDPLIIRVLGTRVGLAARLADSVLVQAV